MYWIMTENVTIVVFLLNWSLCSPPKNHCCGEIEMQLQSRLYSNSTSVVAPEGQAKNNHFVVIKWSKTKIDLITPKLSTHTLLM